MEQEQQQEQEQEQGCNSVEDYVVGSLPTLIYIPNFITEAEQSELLHHEGSCTRRGFCHKNPHQDGPAYFPVASILSLQSPVVIDFTPHPKWREYGEKERLRSENLSNLEEQISEVVKEDLLNESVCSLKDDQCSLLLMPCSLLLFKDQAYSGFLHGIKDSTVHSLSKVINVSECMKLEEWKEGHPTTNGKTQEHCFNRTSTRVSLTCRLVPKVCKNLFKF